MTLKYSMIIQWSDEDQLFVVTLPEFQDVAQPVTHGKSYEEAAKQGQEVIETLVELYQKENRTLPNPSIFNSASQVA
ncbi:MAG: type II toxin-antitoxin system HicB family antitoxin [Coleofasciculaceae cyanobacterium]